MLGLASSSSAFAVRWRMPSDGSLQAVCPARASMSIDCKFIPEVLGKNIAPCGGICSAVGVIMPPRCSWKCAFPAVFSTKLADLRSDCNLSVFVFTSPVPPLSLNLLCRFLRCCWPSAEASPETTTTANGCSSLGAMAGGRGGRDGEDDGSLPRRPPTPPEATSAGPDGESEDASLRNGCLSLLSPSVSLVVASRRRPEAEHDL